MTSAGLSSPLLQLPGAVDGNGVDAGVAAHYGSFNLEQRTLESGEGFVDLSHRDVIAVTGPDRLSWLHSLTTQALAELAPQVWTQVGILSPQGHLEHLFHGYDDGETFLAHTEPGAGAPVVEFLDRMRFMMRVEVSLRTADLATVWRPETEGRGGFALIARGELPTYAEAAEPACGTWAFEALRIARGEPRLGLDTDHKAIPNELGLLNDDQTGRGAVHLNKGCYRGQETVARIHNLGKPPRRLTLLHFDGSENRLPHPGDEITGPDGGRVIGRMGSSARHHELGPIGLALLSTRYPTDHQVLVAGSDEQSAPALVAAQEVIVDPAVGLHFRPKLR